MGEFNKLLKNHFNFYLDTYNNIQKFMREQDKFELIGKVVDKNAIYF
jgi:hypothetical protein